VKHLTMQELEAALDHLRQAPKDDGVLQLIVCRPQEDQRQEMDQAELDPVKGLIGDSWSVRGSRRTPDGSAHPDMQINIMNTRRRSTLYRHGSQQRKSPGRIAHSGRFSGAGSQSSATHRLPQVRRSVWSRGDEVCEFRDRSATLLARNQRQSGPRWNRQTRPNRKENLSRR